MRPCIIENLKYHTINSHYLLLRYSVFYWSHISISEIYTLHEKLWKVRWPHVEKMHLYFYFIKLMPVYLQTALPSIDLVVKVFASMGLWVRILDLIWAQKFTFLSKKTNQPLLFVFIMDKKQVECPVNSQPLKKKTLWGWQSKLIRMPKNESSLKCHLRLAPGVSISTDSHFKTSIVKFEFSISLTQESDYYFKQWWISQKSPQTEMFPEITLIILLKTALCPLVWA